MLKAIPFREEYLEDVVVVEKFAAGAAGAIAPSGCASRGTQRGKLHIVPGETICYTDIGSFRT
jgi:hypothetical protein